MTHRISRRDFLLAAGGVTFLALAPTRDGLFAAPAPSNLPLFTALPYVQPGNNSKLIDGAEAIVVAWQTVNEPVGFTVEYGPTPKYGRKVTPLSAERWQGGSDGKACLNYTATLAGLKLSTKYYYKVTGNGTTVLEGFFTTRCKRGEAIRFVAFGDNSFGDPGEKAIACLAFKSNPDFVMNTGDNVYNHGLDREYAQFFFPVYNADVADPAVGAPLLRSVPFYTVLANHDVAMGAPNGGPVADFTINPDSLAYYTAMHLPLNGPVAPAYPTPCYGNLDSVKAFKQVAGGRYPRMANYSYDYGDAHFTCLDSNDYLDPTNPELQAWLNSDLASTDAKWKFVVYHHPAFNVGDEHYHEQQMRTLSPILEKHGVDVVLNGHEHVYQRSRPLKFAPTTPVSVPINTGKRMVPGTFTTDNEYDGVTKTKPNGVIYVTSGAGGKKLYDPQQDNDPTAWIKPDDDVAASIAKFRSAKHSFTVIDLVANKLTLKQIDEDGTEIDRLVVTKS